MTSEEKKVELKDLLKDIYKDVTEWLKFAEAKNGILLTVNGVLLFGLLRIVSTNNDWFKSFENTILLASLILILSMLVVLASYIPRLNINKEDKQKVKLSNPNLLYYKDIAMLSKEEYISQLQNKYYSEINEKDENFVNNQIEQILSLSKIAVRKYKFFNAGVLLVAISLLTIIIKVFFTYLG